MSVWQTVASWNIPGNFWFCFCSKSGFWWDLVQSVGGEGDSEVFVKFGLSKSESSVSEYKMLFFLQPLSFVQDLAPFWSILRDFCFFFGKKCYFRGIWYNLGVGRVTGFEGGLRSFCQIWIFKK